MFIYIIAVCALGADRAAAAVFGTEIYGATNWIVVNGISLQPSELVKVALLLVLSYFMSRRRFLAVVPLFGRLYGGADVPKGPWHGADLLHRTSLMLYYASTGNLWMTGVGLLGGAARRRCSGITSSPTSSAASPYGAIRGWILRTRGYQIAQILMAIASGGLFGVGLGLGTPTIIPVYHTDAIFAVICEQFGIIFGDFSAGDVRHPHTARRGHRAGRPAQLPRTYWRWV